MVPVEDLTTFPHTGWPGKNLASCGVWRHLGKRNDATHLSEMAQYSIPEIDLVIVDLYPFEETVATTTEEAAIIEKIDIGGPSMIRAAAKNHRDLVVLANKADYAVLNDMLIAHRALPRWSSAGPLLPKPSKWWRSMMWLSAAGSTRSLTVFQTSTGMPNSLRYGENPHQQAQFFAASVSCLPNLMVRNSATTTWWM